MPDSNKQENHQPSSQGQIPPEPPANWSPDNPNGSDNSSGYDNSSYSNGSNNYNDSSFGPNGSEPVFKSPGSGPTRDPYSELNAAFATARKYVTASQVCAIVSLFIGGMILSTVAVVLAFVGYRKYSDLKIQGHIDDRTFTLIRRSCIIAGTMAAAALALNVISFIAIYPLVMEYIQTGDMSVLFGGMGEGSGIGSTGAGTAGGTGSGSSTWG